MLGAPLLVRCAATLRVAAFALAMIGAYTRHSEVGALAPVLILIVPILDTTLVVLARLASGQSPFKGSNDHFAIRLKARGFSARGVALFAYGLGLRGAAGGVAPTLVETVAAVAITAATALLFAGVLLWLWRSEPASGGVPEGRAVEPAAD